MIDQYEPLTLQGFCKMLGLPDLWKIYTKNGIPKGWVNSTGELSPLYMRSEIREREDGVQEVAVYIPFKVEGL